MRPTTDDEKGEFILFIAELKERNVNLPATSRQIINYDPEKRDKLKQMLQLGFLIKEGGKYLYTLEGKEALP